MKKALTLILITCLLSGISQAQHKTSMDVKDLNSDIEKYIKTNYPDYKTNEAFKYDVMYEMVMHKADTSKYLVFDADGKFVRQKREAANAKIGLQSRSTMAIEDVQENITKYIGKNYKGYKLFEAYKYHEIYTAKVAKGAISETMAFDKAGNFLQKVIPPAPVTAKPAENSYLTDTLHHAKNATPSEPVKK